MDLDKLRELIGIFESSELSEIEIEEQDRRIRLTKGHAQHAHAPQPIITHIPVHAPVPAPIPAAPVSQPAPGVEHPPAPEMEEGVVTIDSPMVGVFYAAPAPGEPPFVSPGDVVEEGQTVCIVEAMKLMNEVAAKIHGTIVSVLVENGEPVEYNQPLFAVRPIE
ncbi:MAG: acetyl-CoA carboxylase biotin carboxyl carrier protein [Candidatus Hydrogenedentes bacterium]|nr:acetyl-CoA carboxylase biotin carboxyl carrier protein [Candidatus Hydrogenedentota bacterium]